MPEAIAAFRQAKHLKPTLTLDPDAEARSFAVLALRQKGEVAATAGEISKAKEAFSQAKELDPTLLDPEIETRRFAVPALRQKGEVAARAGEISKAKEAFSQAKELDPTLTLDPESEANRARVQGLLQTGMAAAKAGEVSKAKEAYAEARRLDPAVDFGWQFFNFLCFKGSLARHADEVLESCQEAVSRNPEQGMIRDSRGLARILTGDREGAIEDFKAFIAWTRQDQQSNGSDSEYLQYVAQERERWITDLEAGRNPFDAATLAATLEAIRKE
ncbi:MAG TPA: tetratricopeptide repeat protein [Terriglobia bacterium]|nr:tetratricopeptide repeat protein [Terriglobia bacterium]